jgi:hypothetical protein
MELIDKYSMYKQMHIFLDCIWKIGCNNNLLAQQQRTIL